MIFKSNLTNNIVKSIVSQSSVVRPLWAFTNLSNTLPSPIFPTISTSNRYILHLDQMMFQRSWKGLPEETGAFLISMTTIDFICWNVKNIWKLNLWELLIIFNMLDKKINFLALSSKLTSQKKSFLVFLAYR